MTFQRARSEAQREERRTKILAAAVAMLSEMPVAEISLNELSRRAGLAKSNVLRYFESREAVLLELVDERLRAWTLDLDQVPSLPEGNPRQRGTHLAVAIASSLAERPVLCDLLSAQASVLERNVSQEVVLRHKRETQGRVAELNQTIQRHLPELSTENTYTLIAYVLLMASALWPHNRPNAAVLAAYAADPSVAAMRMDFTFTIQQLIELTVSGLLALDPHLPPPA